MDCNGTIEILFDHLPSTLRTRKHISYCTLAKIRLTCTKQALMARDKDETKKSSAKEAVKAKNL